MDIDIIVSNEIQAQTVKQMTKGFGYVWFGCVGSVGFEGICPDPCLNIFSLLHSFPVAYKSFNSTNIILNVQIEFEMN